MRFLTLVWRSACLRCPVCGKGKLYRGWWRMNETCEHCGASFVRESGFFLGAIYFNYGLTALFVAVAYPLLVFSRDVPSQKALVGCMAFTLLFPLLFFRHARSLWLGFDEFVDPRRNE